MSESKLPKNAFSVGDAILVQTSRCTWWASYDDDILKCTVETNSDRPARALRRLKRKVRRLRRLKRAGSKIKF